MENEESILILLDDKNIAFIPENNILPNNYKKPYIEIFFSYEKIRFKCKEAKQHFYSQSDNYDNVFIEENMIKILYKENHACYCHPYGNILYDLDSAKGLDSKYTNYSQEAFKNYAEYVVKKYNKGKYDKKINDINNDVNDMISRY